jgi:hypothetical protein
MTKEERLLKQKEYRLQNSNLCTKKYEKTKQGKLVRTYRNMQIRVWGMLEAKAHLYEGLPLLDRGDFYSWSLNNQSFNDLFDCWVVSGYSRKLSPSIDRINSSLGYVLENMRWLTHSENSRLGAMSRCSK